MSVPRSDISRISDAPLNVSARWRVCSTTSRGFAVKPPSIIIRSVTPGMLAVRTPASFACFRALVCVSDIVVGAITTSTLRIASATARGGSSPWRERGGIVIIIASQSTSRAVSYNDLAILILSVSVTISTVSDCFKPRYVCKMVHELLYPLMGSLPSKSLSALPLYNYFMHW